MFSSTHMFCMGMSVCIYICLEMCRLGLMKVCRVQMYVVYIEGEGEGKAEKEKEGEEKREGKSTPLNASRVRSVTFEVSCRDGTSRIKQERACE